MENKNIFLLIIFLLCFSCGAISDALAASNIVAQWHFDEGEGNIASDSSVNGYHGTIYGGAEWVPGISGSALRFDGLDNYVDIPGSESLNLAGGFELEAWVRFTEYNWDNPIVSKHISDIGAGYVLGVRDNRFIFYLNNGGPRTLDTPEFYNDGQWHHVLGVYDGTTQSLFVDGILKDQQTNVYTLFSPATIHIGGLFAGRYNAPFVGDIDEVRISTIPEPDPIQEILSFIEESVADGTLVPVKDGKAGQGQLGALTNMIETAGNLIDANDPNSLAEACGQLHAALGKTDGQDPPPDFVTGQATAELAQRIEDLMVSLGCE